MSSVRVDGLSGSKIEIAAGTLNALAKSLDGSVMRPGDAGYETSRKVWNGMFDRRPAVILRCASEADIIAAVRFAAEHEIEIAVKGGGHSVAGHSASNGGLLVDLSALRHVSVDPNARRAAVGPGAIWRDLDTATQAYGLATPGGEVSVTGVAGLTLGGGMGFIRRAFGLSSDNLESVRIVTADGEVRVASADSEPDLYWALRGGGGNFGIVSQFTFRLHELGPEVFSLSVAYPAENAESIVRRFRDHAEKMPREVSLNLELMGVPAMSMFPEEIHGAPIVNVEAIHVGDPEIGSRVLDPLRRLEEPMWDESGVTSYVEVQQAFDAILPEGGRYFWKSHFLNELADEAIDRIVDWARRSPNPGLLFVLRHLGGAYADMADGETAFANRSARYNLSLDNGWTDPADDERNVAFTRECWADLREVAAGGVYLNFWAEGESGFVRQGLRNNMARLAEVKRRYDPENLFRRNANIQPAEAAAHLA